MVEILQGVRLSSVYIVKELSPDLTLVTIIVIINPGLPIEKTVSCCVPFSGLLCRDEGSLSELIVSALSFCTISLPLRYGMSQQKSVSPFPGSEEGELPICCGPQMAAKSWLLLLQLSFGEWVKS